MSVSTGLFSWSNIAHRNLSFFSLTHRRLAAYHLEAKWAKGIMIRTKNILCLLVMTRTFMIHFSRNLLFRVALWGGRIVAWHCWWSHRYLLKSFSTNTSVFSLTPLAWLLYFGLHNYSSNWVFVECLVGFCFSWLPHCWHLDFSFSDVPI